MAVYAMFGVLMLTSKILMEAVPNVHLLGMFTMLLTVVYRRRALYPIYVYVLLNGVYAGFASWWLPYLYIWTDVYKRQGLMRLSSFLGSMRRSSQPRSSVSSMVRLVSLPWLT